MTDTVQRSAAVISRLLGDIGAFCEYGSQLKLRSYQLEAARAIVDSVLNRKGLTFVIIFPRQSGKNELQAQIEAYLLAVFHSSTPRSSKSRPPGSRSR